MQTISQHPWVILFFGVLGISWLFGPVVVGAWIGEHMRWLIIGAWHFAAAVFHGVF